MPSPSALDEFIDRIVREVIRRLRAEENPNKGGRTLCLPERLITAASIETLPAGTSEISIAPRAILTPLARDEARDRGIRIVRQPQGATT